MRLATRGTLLALAAFLVLLTGFALWSEYQLRSLGMALMEGTARLLGTEIAAVVKEVAAEDLLQADPEAQQRLDAFVADLSANSEVIASVTVVDASGRVVASKDVETGRQLARPEMIFDAKKRSQFLTSVSPLEGGQYHVFVPLVKADSISGYLRLSLSSNRLIALYQRARRQLAWLVVGGLALVALMGLALEVQFSRLGRTLTQVFESATRGATVSEPSYRDDFSDAIAAARRAGQELNVARTQSADAEKRFTELMKVMDVGVVLVGADYALDFANESARQLLGCGAAGELEQHWPRVQQQLAAATADEKPAGAVVDLDNDQQFGRARLELYPREDRAGWLVLVKNRGVLESLENELRLAIQMRGFAQFYFAFAHDLKAPLNAMVLNLELLKQSLADDRDSEAEVAEVQTRQRKYIQTLVGEVSRLDRSLRTVLTHAMPAKEGRRQFDIREVVDELAELLSPQARHQRVELTMHKSEDPLMLDGHRDRLKQAMLNLAINALESMPDGGRLSIDIHRRDQQAAISIQDTGAGIPPEVLKEIFKMHFTTKNGGTGIGLYVARSVVQAHGGDIHVESEVGRGTCFRLTLPLVAV
jgi:signal transduction histidine kinase